MPKSPIDHSSSGPFRERILKASPVAGEGPSGRVEGADACLVDLASSD